jgi:hypothetical protein
MTALTATRSIKEMVSAVVRESLDQAVGSRLDSAA